MGTPFKDNKCLSEGLDWLGGGGMLLGEGVGVDNNGIGEKLGCFFFSWLIAFINLGWVGKTL